MKRKKMKRKRLDCELFAVDVDLSLSCLSLLLPKVGPIHTTQTKLPIAVHREVYFYFLGGKSKTDTFSNQGNGH